MYKTVAIFGDIGGHRDLYEEALDHIGVTDGHVPSDLAVIQVGDLVDRGPDSDGVVELVSSLLENPNYYQLVGNHEAKYLGGPNFTEAYGRAQNGPSVPKIHEIQEWWLDHRMHVAVGVVGQREWLVTHAGLTKWKWDQYNSRNLTHIVDLLNSLAPERVFSAGGSLDGHALEAGPVWANLKYELIPSWLGNDMPFNQVHGHTTLVNWNNVNKSRLPEDLEGMVSLDVRKRHTAIDINGKKLIQVDPGLGEFASFVPAPFIIENAEIIGG